MVFFIVACHLADKEDDQVEQVLRGQVASSMKQLGEVYAVDVTTLCWWSHSVGGQEEVQDWHTRLLNGVEWDPAEDRFDSRQHCQEDREASQGNRQPRTQNWVECIEQKYIVMY